MLLLLLLLLLQLLLRWLLRLLLRLMLRPGMGRWWMRLDGTMLWLLGSRRRFGLFSIAITVRRRVGGSIDDRTEIHWARSDEG